MSCSFRMTGSVLAIGILVLSACNQGPQTAVVAKPSTTFSSNPCVAATNVQLSVAQATRIDCSNGGTTVTLAGNGASYLVVPQFATDQIANQFYSYTMATGTVAAASASGQWLPAARRTLGNVVSSAGAGLLPPVRPRAAQLAAERFLRQRARQNARSASVRASVVRQPASPWNAAAAAPPALGTSRTFHVASSFSVNTWKTVGAQLAFVGSNLLLYIDTLAPSNGFTATQLTSFGQLFDQTLYPIDTAAFGAPSDVDQNGRVIMLMSPVVNGDTPASTCATSGFVAGFFDTEDFNGPTDPNSNQAEIFYSIVPDPAGTYSCAHTVSDLGNDIPATFLHELQHLIYYSQHVIVGGASEGSSWMDEGLSIVAEELGSLYYEQKCPPPSCRSNAAQLFPDSAQGFIQSFLYDSYEYALLPDTVSLTLHDDSEDGFSWRGGDWLLMRWLGDQMGSGFFRKLERGPANGITNIEQATGQSFPALFANFGLSLYTDSLPGLARTTAPAANRFTSRNMKQLWARLFVTSGPTSDIPLANPVQLFAITTDTSAAMMSAGTMTYFRLDTPANSATVTIRFAAPGGAPFAAAMRSQIAIFRLPAGQ
ncbi:MAG: hypothetical protein ACHQQ3_06555 [Gemmatimonadales bacterium]